MRVCAVCAVLLVLICTDAQMHKDRSSCWILLATASNESPGILEASQLSEACLLLSACDNVQVVNGMVFVSKDWHRLMPI
jgi:hypothetical protein